MIQNPNHRFILYVIAVIVLAIAFIYGVATDPSGEIATKGLNIFLLLVSSMAAANTPRGGSDE